MTCVRVRSPRPPVSPVASSSSGSTASTSPSRTAFSSPTNAPPYQSHPPGRQNTSHTSGYQPPPASYTPYSPPPPAPSFTPSSSTPQLFEFEFLRWILTQAEQENLSPMPTAVVGTKLSGQAKTLYSQAGVSKFKQYVELAAAMGFVRIEPGPVGNEWLQSRISLVR